MPLFKRKQFQFCDPPAELAPDEQVWQIRFTKEIFRSYEEYLKYMNLYRQRVWTCKVTGKTNLTYEQALVSERQASEKTLEFPKGFIPHVLRVVQFCTLNLDDLVSMIYERLKGCFLEGEEVQGKRGNSDCLCKILKVLAGNKCTLYNVAWLDEGGGVVNTSVEDSGTLTRKKAPVSRHLLKMFIKRSIVQTAPWVVNHKLAKQHGIPVEPPEHLRDKVVTSLNMSSDDTTMGDLGQETDGVEIKKRAKTENDDQQIAKRAKAGKKHAEGEIIKYPIEDLLVKASASDPNFSTRPIPSTSFLVPMDTVGDLLMVWDFCSSFGKLLNLSPFSLEDFENAILYEGLSEIIAEAHSAFLTLLIKDQGEYHLLTQQKKRKGMITAKNWLDYLSDFVELGESNNMSRDFVSFKRGQYHSLDVRVKLDILGGLVHSALLTDSVRAKLDVCIEQHEALLATKREENLAEARKRRDEKQLKAINKGCLENKNGRDKGSEKSVEAAVPNGAMEQRMMEKILVGNTLELQHSQQRGKETSRAVELKRPQEMKKEHETLRTEELKRLREEKKVRDREARERRLKAQREEQFKRELEKFFIRTNTLGKDRDHNRYWFFQREGRLFVESVDHKKWGFYASKEELDGLIGSLNPKGVRELALKLQLEQHYSKICAALQKRSRDAAQKVVLDTAVLRRSVRVSVPPKDRNAPSFLKYVNKWRI